MMQSTFLLSGKALGSLALGLLAMTSTVQAATWDVGFGSCSSSSNPYSTAGNWGSMACATSNGVSDPSVAGLAWSAKPDLASSVTGASVVSWDSNGLGIMAPGDTNTDGPHAFDSYGYFDSIVLKFGQTVSMESLSIGWNGTDQTSGPYDDSDLAIFAWKGVAGSTPNSLTGGWEQVALKTNVGASNGSGFGGSTSFNSTQTFSSSYWLIAAYGTDTIKDSFKLLSVAGSLVPPPTGVPEPGSLALLGLGAAGLLAARRKSVARC